MKKTVKSEKYRSPWSVIEMAFVKENYGLMMTSRIAEMLGRTENAVRWVIRRLDISLTKKYRPWSEVEKNIIHTYSSRPDGINLVVSILQWRTRDSILRMMEKLTIPESRGMRPKKWKVEELRILEQYYPLEGTAVASRLPGRTPCAVKNIARLHGIKSGLLPTKWTPEELHRIHENSHLPLAEMTALFPERTQTAVRKALESERKRQRARAAPGQVSDKAAAKKQCIIPYSIQTPQQYPPISTIKVWHGPRMRNVQRGDDEDKGKLFFGCEG